MIGPYPISLIHMVMIFPKILPYKSQNRLLLTKLWTKFEKILNVLTKSEIDDRQRNLHTL